MANDVFANGLEIACKAADGKSVAAFPDPCWTPPSPNAGWILIPYANTAYARDTANASKTVFISGKPVMKKDQSYFKTSFGNEPAAGPKGLRTGVKKGKAYFTSWSMNVKIEGMNVDRHTDGMTHNHGSQAGNTGPHIYIDEENPGKCKNALNEMKKRCAIDTKENKDFEDSAKSRNKRRAKHKKPQYKVREKTWKDKHCKGVLLDPTRADYLEKKLKNLKNELEDLKDDFQNAAIDIVGAAAAKKMERAAEVAGCAGIGGLIGGAIGFFFAGVGAAPGAALGAEIGGALCGAAATAEAMADTVSAGIEIWNNQDKIREAIGELKGRIERVDKLSDYLKETDPNKRAQMKRELEDAIRQAAQSDPCLEARRCILTPWKGEADMAEVKEKKRAKNPMDKIFGLDDMSGCCPGQTGHHLIYDAAVGDCPGYTKKGAPTVCVEGGNQHCGTHGCVHDHTDENNQKMANGEYPRMKECAETYTLDCAIEAAADAHHKTFSQCKKACIVQQLKSYFDKNCQVSRVNKQGKPIKPTKPAGKIPR